MSQAQLGFMEGRPEPRTEGPGRAAPETLSTDLQAVLSSGNKHWCTPQKVLKLVRAFDTIGLDPCSNPAAIVGATTAWQLPEDNGLVESWEGHGLVWMNPPFGEEKENGTTIQDWVQKAAYEAAHGVEIIGLVPSYTGAAWFQENCAPPRTAVCFWRGRIKFLGAEHGCTFSTALVYWGPRVELFAKIFATRGLIWRTPDQGLLLGGNT